MQAPSRPSKTRIAALVTSFVVPIPLMFFFCEIHGSYGYFMLVIIQLSLFPLAVVCAHQWWAAYGLGLAGMFIGHAASIGYDVAYRLHDHHLFPIELAFSMLLSFLTMVPGILVCLLIRKASEKVGKPG